MTVEEIKTKIEGSIPGSRAEIIANGSPSAQHSLLIDNEHALPVATLLRDDPALRLDYCSCVTGIDWLEREISEKVKAKKTVTAADGSSQEQEVEEVRKTRFPGYLEAVYHLFSTEIRPEAGQTPVVLRMRTAGRESAHLPSLTLVWRSAEFQEREIFDLYGIVFDGHPDLRRILMWDSYTDHPMRRDYVPPPDDEPQTAPQPVNAGGQ